MAYGAKYLVEDTNPNGLEERVRLFRWQWTGGVTTLTGAGDAWFEQTTRIDDPFDPVAEGRAALRVLGRYGSVLAEVQGAEDAAFLLVWETEIGGSWTVRWWGFLEQQGYADYPYEPLAAVEVSAVDGIGLLEQKLYDPEGAGFGVLWAARQLVYALSRAAPDDSAVGLGPGTDLGTAAASPPGLVTRMGWVPWLPSPVPSGLNALNQVILPLGIWADESGERRSTLLEVLRQVVGRFGCRLFQSRGRWFCVQPHRYLPDASGAVDAFVYGAASDADAGASGAATALPVELDADGWRFRKGDGPERGIAHPVREAVSVYDFEPDLDNVFENGSFEDAGSASDEAAYWTGYTDDGVGNPLFERVDVSTLSFFSATAGNQYAAEIGSIEPEDPTPPVRLEQTSPTYVPGVRGAVFDLSLSRGLATGTATPPEAFFGFNDGSASGADGVAWWVQAFAVTPVSDSLQGRGVTLYVEPVGAALPGAVAGVPIIPAEATLRFWDGSSAFIEFTLTEGVAVGEITITGDLSAELDASAVAPAEAYYWRTEDGGGPYAVSLVSGDPAIAFYEERLVRMRMRLPLNSPSGATVSGSAYAGFPVTRSLGSTALHYVDALVGRVEYDRQTASEIAYQAALVTGSGLSVALPSRGVGDSEWLLGDGPSLDSLGGLGVRDGDNLVQATLQGADTGWKVGPYAALEASSGRTIDALAAIEVVRSRGVTLERWAFTVEGRDSAGAPVVIDPENVIAFRPPMQLAYHVFAGATEIATHTRLRDGEAVTLVAVDGTSETFTVAVSDQPGGGPFYATLDAATTKAYPAYLGGQPYRAVRPTRRLLWDELTQRPGAGTVTVRATELYLDEDVGALETILQQ